ncbi:MAG: hypothetical protein JOZ39_12115 [Chloroflexi bacterium]|nr:hypothetical protein [Chloroflexota bacterium]
MTSAAGYAPAASRAAEGKAATRANFERWLSALPEWHTGPRKRPSRTPRSGGRAVGASRGGQQVLSRYGEQFFSAIGSRGGQTVAAERGREYLRDLGVRGGEVTRRKYGRDHFAEIGRKGGLAGRGRKRKRVADTAPEDLQAQS